MILKQVRDPSLKYEIENINNICDASDPYTSTTAPGNHRFADAAHLKLHLKLESHQRLHMDKLHALQVNEEFDDVVAKNESALRWTYDVSRYAGVGNRDHTFKANEIPITYLTSADIKEMLRRNVIREISLKDIRGRVRVFPIPEWLKHRRRIVRHTTDINDWLDKTTVATVDMATKRDLMSFAHMGTHVLSLDAQAFYDQFPITDEVGAYSCFRKGRKFYALTTAPTGQRHTVEVGHTTLQRLIHMPGKRCTTLAIIDNAYFAGSAEDCEHDGGAFLERCRDINCAINGDPDAGNLSELIVREADCGGIRINMELKTIRLPEKMLDKIRLSWDLRPRWTRRSFVSHMGLLFWSVGIVTANPGDYFECLRDYARLCREMAYYTDDTARDAYLDAAIEFQPEPLRDLESWTLQVLKNLPRRAPKPDGLQSAPDWIACVDACGTGFGYFAINPETGETRSYGRRWPREFEEKHRALLHRSVFTEPHGVIMSMCHLLNHTGVHQHVFIFTDSVTTMAGGNRGYNSRSAEVNDILKRLRNLFPEDLYQFTFAHIAGKDNIVADALSRGRAPTSDEIDGARHRLLQWSDESYGRGRQPDVGS